MALTLAATTSCGQIGASSGKSSGAGRLNLDINLQDVSANGCLNVEKLVSRLAEFPETVLMKEFTTDFELTDGSPSRNIELYLAKASFIFRFQQTTEFAAEFGDLRQADCKSVTEVEPFVAPEITPEDDPNSDPEEAGGGGGGDPMPSEPGPGGDGPNPNPDIPPSPGGRSHVVSRDDAPIDASGPEPFTIDEYGEDFLTFSRSDGSSYTFRWIDKGTIEVSYGYKSELFRCNREYNTPLRYTRTYRWSGERTNASVDEQVSANYLKLLLDATDSSVSFGFSSSSISSTDGSYTLHADDLFRLASAPADSSLYRCR